MTTYRRFVSLSALAATAALLPLATGPASAQAPAAKAAKSWTTPKTPWGDPDLQGVWPGTAMVGTPMERAKEFGARANLTDEEYARKVAHADEQEAIDTAEFPLKDPKVSRGDTFITCEQDPDRCRNGVRIGPPNYWDEHGKPSRQASLIVDPPDGRIPPLTPEAQKAAADRNTARRARPCAASGAGCHDTWEDESLWDRCITRGTVGSIVPNTYNQGNQIVQAPGLVVLRNEMIHESRVIPVDGRAHASSSIRTWMGDSRGHWEGSTLVVETTNFRAGTQVGQTAASEDLKLIERFTRTDAETLQYELTVNDPKTWTKPWKLTFPLKHDREYTLYEYACHEGNYYMYNALAGARAAEKKGK